MLIIMIIIILESILCTYERKEELGETEPRLKIPIVPANCENYD